MQLPTTARVDTGVGEADRQARRRQRQWSAGDIHSIAGGGFVVTMKLVSADSGQELASLSESAGGAKDLIPTIGKLTRKLRERMGESLKHVQASGELAQVTTKSLPALQKYTEGQRALSVELNLDKAIPLFREAIAIDTGFASAYRALAIALGNRGQDRDGQVRALEHAYAHADRLPEVERFLSIAAYWNQGPRPGPKESRAGVRVAARHSARRTMRRSTTWRCSTRSGATSPRPKNCCASRSPRIPSALTAYGNLMTYQAEQGKIAAMESTYVAQLKASGNNPRIALGRVSILFSQGKYDSTDALIDSIVKASPGQADLIQQRNGVTEATALVRGKLAESLRLASPERDRAEEAGPGRRAARRDLRLGDGRGVVPRIEGEGGRDHDGGTEADAARRASLRSIARTAASRRSMPLRVVRISRARCWPSSTEPRATMTPAGASAAAPLHSRRDRVGRASLSGRRARGSGGRYRSVHDLRGAARSPTRTTTPTNQTRRVRNTRNTSSRRRSPGRFGNDGIFLAGAYKRLGELWEAKGDKVKAAGYYTKFVSMWKDADPELQPKVSEVRKRLVRLEQIRNRSAR